MGKGDKEREVVIFDDVKALLDDNQRDLQAFHQSEAARRGTAPAPTTDADAKVSAPAPEAIRPLVGALKRPVSRWRTDAAGEADLDDDPAPHHATGALEPSALRARLKRLFARAATTLTKDGTEDADRDRQTFVRATTHWMRHFFASTALHDGVALVVVRDLLGHAGHQHHVDLCP